MSSELDENYEGNSFEYRLREVSDDEIITILRYREHYQPNSVKGAIKEALRRGIISSVSDLDNDEFKPQNLPPKSFFPLGNNLPHNQSILKGLCRIFYGLGIIPIIYAYFQITDKHAGMAVLSLLTGLVFLVLTNRLDQKQKPVFSFMLLLFNLVAIGFAIYKLITAGSLVIMDFAATIIILVVIMYTTLYAHKLTTFIQKETTKGQSVH